MLEALSNILIYGGSFVVVLSLVVFVHEWGHFQAARMSGVAVDTFSIGFGKTLASWRDKQGVQWRIAALPLGGYVKFADDQDAVSSAPVQAYSDAEAKAEARKRGLFHAQPVGIRAFVVAAGPSMNFIFSILVFAALVFAFGQDATDRNALSARVDMIREGSPAAVAGLQPGDLIVAVDGAPVESWGALQDRVRASPGAPLTFEVSREGARQSLVVTPEPLEVLDATGVASTVGIIGVERQTLRDERVIERLNPLEAIGAGAAQTWRIIASTGAYVGNILSGRASPEHISGAVGIMQASGDIARGAIAPEEVALWDRVSDLALALLQWAAILSVAVGIVNLLPVPVLDGGHLVFYAIEAARGGRPLPAVAQEWAFRGGLAMLLCLFAFATWNDLHRIFMG